MNFFWSVKKGRGIFFPNIVEEHRIVLPKFVWNCCQHVGASIRKLAATNIRMFPSFSIKLRINYSVFFLYIEIFYLKVYGVFLFAWDRNQVARQEREFLLWRIHFALPPILFGATNCWGNHFAAGSGVKQLIERIIQVVAFAKLMSKQGFDFVAN